jgi:hypothetical protein
MIVLVRTGFNTCALEPLPAGTAAGAWQVGDALQ